MIGDLSICEEQKGEIYHYSYVTWTSWYLESATIWLFVQELIQVENK